MVGFTGSGSVHHTFRIRCQGNDPALLTVNGNRHPRETEGEGNKRSLHNERPVTDFAREAAPFGIGGLDSFWWTHGIGKSVLAPHAQGWINGSCEIRGACAEDSVGFLGMIHG